MHLYALKWIIKCLCLALCVLSSCAYLHLCILWLPCSLILFYLELCWVKRWVELYCTIVRNKLRLYTVSGSYCRRHFCFLSHDDQSRRRCLWYYPLHYGVVQIKLQATHYKLLVLSRCINQWIFFRWKFNSRSNSNILPVIFPINWHWFWFLATRISIVISATFSQLFHLISCKIYPPRKHRGIWTNCVDYWIPFLRWVVARFDCWFACSMMLIVRFIADKGTYLTRSDIMWQTNQLSVFLHSETINIVAWLELRLFPYVFFSFHYSFCLILLNVSFDLLANFFRA